MRNSISRISSWESDHSSASSKRLGIESGANA
jgi:hypothetical protein